MRHSVVGALLGVAISTIPGYLAAADKGSSMATHDHPMPTPPPAIDATYKMLEGSWKCDSKMPAGAMGPGSAEMTAKSTIKIKKDLNGFWYVGDYESKKSKDMPALKVQIFWGADQVSKQLVMVSFDSAGGMSHLSSPGMEADTLTFTGDGEHMGQKVKIRESMTKKSDKEIVHRFDVDQGKGFQTMGEDDCKK